MTEKLKPIPFDRAKKPEQPPELPADLNGQVQSIRAFATTYNLLAQANFPSSHFQIVSQCMEFNKAMHLAAIKAASTHESAHLVPEIEKFLKEQSFAGELETQATKEAQDDKGN